MVLRICLVTTEFHGLFKNGGIGTANTGLALTLAAAEHEVIVAYIDYEAAATLGQNEAFLAQRAHWRERGIFLDYVPRGPRLKATAEDFCWAFSTLEYLKGRRFDVVLFNECGGCGYYALLAKRAGVFPDPPRMIVVTHGASDWARELNGQLPVNYRAAALAFFERRSVELADLVVSPSDYLVGWMRARGWRLPAATETLQNVVPVAATAQGAAPPAAAVDEIVFFGRLEARKGVEIFCDAIDELDRAGKLGGVGVTFLGKFSRVGPIHSGVFLIERSRGWSVSPRFLVDRGQGEALDYLSRPGVLAVMPSLAENSPCVVVECLAAGVSFVATDSGGTAELVAEPDRGLCLAPPQAPAIAGRIAEALEPGPARARLAQPQSDTAARWRALVERVETPATPPVGAARVSLCVSLPAGAELAPDVLDALRRQTRAADIVVVAYGAEADRREAAGSEICLSRRSPDRAAARNAAAAEASGDWLMFVRERDLLLPHAAATLIAAAARLGAQAITGLAYERRRPGRPSLDWDGELGSPPFGPCAALAPFENCLGDDVFAISRPAFEALGGYESGVGAGLEDRLLLTRALAAGVSVDLVPEPLAWRQVAPRRQGDEVADLRRVLAVYRDAPLAAFSAAVESLFAQGPQQIRARAAAWAAALDEKARELALKLTFQHAAGGPDSFEPFLRYCLERGRLVEALDFARRHDPVALAPVAEAALARAAERNVRESLLAAAAQRPISVSVGPEVAARLRLVSAPGGAAIIRDPHCVASLRLAPGLIVAKAPLACPAGAERLESSVELFGADGQELEFALAVAEPTAQAVVTEDGLSARGGLWWSGWRRAAPGGRSVEVENLPGSTQPLDVFLLARAPALAGPAWAVWRHMTAHGTLSALATPSAVQPAETGHRLPQHLLQAAELLTDVSDFPYSVFLPGEFTLLHPLPRRMALVRVKGAVPPGAAGVRAAFSVENERAHPVAFAFWIREPGAPAPEEDSPADGGAASGWTLCPEPMQSKTAEARLAAPAAAAMDLYLATKVVGFDDVDYCHAGWWELATIEPLTA